MVTVRDDIHSSLQLPRNEKPDSKKKKKLKRLHHRPEHTRTSDLSG